MLRAAAMLAVLLAATVAQAQQSIHYKNMPGMGAWEPDDDRLEAISRATIEEAKKVMRLPVERVVITYGPGGLIAEHHWKFRGYRTAGVEVEIRGPCQSACTLITAYVGKDKLCFSSGAYLAFHAARSQKGEYAPGETGMMYAQQPADIRDWIDRAGGWEKMPMKEWWIMSDRVLWAMGYPRCP